MRFPNNKIWRQTLIFPVNKISVNFNVDKKNSILLNFLKVT